MRVEVPAAEWRERCSAVLDSGGRFLALYAAESRLGRSSSDEGTLGLRALFSTSDGLQLMCSSVADGEAPTIVELAPAAGWDEREASDMYRLRFSGHSPLRPLMAHPKDRASWTVPVSGHDPYEVAVGPIHAGIIESGHFRFHVVGESVLHVDLRLFYKHRGLERAAEGRTLAEGLAYAQRACAACAVSNSVAYAHAAESVLGLWPEPDLSRARTILLELERLYNHLNDLGAICAGVGFDPGSMVFAALKERAQRLNSALTGHRFLFDTIQMGRSDWRVGRDVAADARRELRELQEEARRPWHEMLFSASVQDRLVGIGCLSADEAVRLGTVGPAARAAGLPLDVRLESPRLSYEGFALPVLRSPSGDVAARAAVRVLELEATLAMLDGLLDRAVEPAATSPGLVSSIGIGRVESPRGETHCFVESGEGDVSRMHLRTGSYANWPSLAFAATGSLLPDFPLINKSFELCYSCSDR
jgi:Ni,Fe-hydrogenase III large subunit